MRGFNASIAAAVTVLALGAADGRASANWHSVTVRRHRGTVTAVLRYEARPVIAIGDQGIRDARLELQEGSRVVLNGPIRTTGDQAARLELVDVWGSSEREALVTLSSCGNRCAVQLALALVKDGHGHLIRHDFGGAWPGASAWAIEGRYFVSRDQRFFCNFSDCASATTPIQVFVVDAAGSRLVDVTRRRPDLVARDAKRLLRGYEDEITHKTYGTKARPGYGPLGVLAPWCAEEFLLGKPSVCRSTITHARAQGYLNASNGGTAHAVAELYSDLEAWGY